MHFVNVLLVFLMAVVLLALPQHEAIASGDSFVQWALEQGKGLDSTWSRMTAGATKESTVGSSTASTARIAAPRVVWRKSNSSGTNMSSGQSSTWSPFNNGENWVHSTSGFIHKGSYERFPQSTRNRSGPSRGISKLNNPASARLGIAHDYRRIPNARVPSKSFFHGRSGKWRISPRSGSRISSSRQRSRVSTRSSRRVVRGR